MQDPDTINQENTINYRIMQDTKKRIHALPEDKKQSAWSKYVAPIGHTSDSWMLTAKVF